MSDQEKEPAAKTKAGTKEVLGRWYYKLRWNLLIGFLLVAFLSIFLMTTMEKPSESTDQKKPENPKMDEDAFVYSFFEKPDTWEETLYYKIKKDIRAGLTPHPADTTDMVLIPEGKAIIGTNHDPNGKGQSLPRQVKWLDAFYIDRLEVTNTKYSECVKAQQCMPIVQLPHMIDYDKPNHPALLTYKQAQRYCLWAGKRLPTEEEWEKAVRGEEGRLYPWGEKHPEFNQANICGKECPSTTSESDWEDPYPHTAPVGSFPAGAGPYGLLDTSGNIKEWVNSSRADTEHYGFIARGSSWYSGKAELVTYYRQLWIPGVRVDDKGVRCAADVTK